MWSFCAVCVDSRLCGCVVILFCVFFWQEDEVDPNVVDVNYYICMVHHGQFLCIFKKNLHIFCLPALCPQLLA